MNFTLTQDSVHRLDLTLIQPVIEVLVGDPLKYARQLRFEFDYPRADDDPRELSEIEEIRLWFIRLDSAYPWLPYFLNWRDGELTRYAAMLVPHRFDHNEGLIFNPEALEIFVMHKIFSVHHWLQACHIANNADLRHMAQTLGYDLDLSFFDLL